jgi:hypothetical protein
MIKSPMFRNMLLAGLMGGESVMPDLNEGISPSKPRFSGGYVKGSKPTKSQQQKKKRKRTMSKSSRKGNR